MNNCSYSNPDRPDYKCKRERYGEFEYCIFHLPDPSLILNYNKIFKEEFAKLHEKKDGDWLGFKFNENVKIDKPQITYEIDFSYSEFGKVEIHQGKFEKSITADNCLFKKEIYINAKFLSNFSCQNASFEKPIRLHCTFDATAKFNNTNFWKQTWFGGSFNGEQTGFQDCIFHDSATFSGGRDVTLMIGGQEQNNSTAKIRRLFKKQTGMQHVDFQRPDRVKFVGVDMAKVLLVGTDLRGVHLYDTTWYQKKLGRNGLADEIHTSQTTDETYTNYITPRIESQYRNVRAALEDNKDFIFASDFYIGEMEIRRKKGNFFKQHFFSVEAFYNSLSQYGTNPKRALRILFYFYLLHILLTIFIQKPVLDIWFFSDINIDTYKTIINYSINSLKILTLQKFGPFVENGLCQSMIDCVFRILGPFQIALFLMSIRNRIKRL
ncbi:hypothetical protein [uncultured Desulfobacter sp.]|uniref:hypothetical protein n=1 Tax=uncultured Desulfobacter sp. TaxID=240139 RepID=UPI0029C8483A|nr:hypothetical protein [uncultured Desulfobacter sp.]